MGGNKHVVIITYNCLVARGRGPINSTVFPENIVMANFKIRRFPFVLQILALATQETIRE
jgi:hypothetical protein